MKKSLSITLMLIAVASLLSCTTNHKGETSGNIVQLSDELATIEAVHLYNTIYKYSKQGVLLGHQDDLAYGVGWKDRGFESDIHKVSGQFPAIFGWDLGHIHDTINIDSVNFQRMKEWAIEVHRRGGINTYGWHALNFNTGESSWDNTPCVGDILPGGSLHGRFNESLDLIADFFTALQDDEGNLIPIVFRPWHEMNGGWFWWGTASCSTEEFKSLFQYTVDYLRNNKKLHNILYCFSPDVFESKEEFLKLYPGDAYVDFLGVDDYKGVRDSNSISETINRLEILAGLSHDKKKQFIFSETGQEAIPNNQWFTKVLLPTLMANESTRKVSWVLLWRNSTTKHHYAPYPGHPAANDFIEFGMSDSILFLNDINRIKQQ